MTSSSRRRVVIIEYSTSGAFSITKAFSGGERLHQSLIPSRRKAFFTFKRPLVLLFSAFNLTGKKYCINGEILVKVIDQKHRPNKRIRFIYKIVECLFSPTFCHSTIRIQIQHNREGILDENQGNLNKAQTLVSNMLISVLVH